MKNKKSPYWFWNVLVCLLFLVGVIIFCEIIFDTVKISIREQAMQKTIDSLRKLKARDDDSTEFLTLDSSLVYHSEIKNINQ